MASTFPPFLWHTMYWSYINMINDNEEQYDGKHIGWKLLANIEASSFGIRLYIIQKVFSEYYSPNFFGNSELIWFVSGCPVDLFKYDPNSSSPLIFGSLNIYA